jgi:RNA polymerase sigma-70 factor, ECF subfamily
MTPSTVPSRLTEADRAWFGGRVEALLPELYGRAVRLCRDRSDAEDLVAESVAKAWEALPSLADRGAFRGWLFQILNNGFVSSCRSARAKAVHEPLDGAGEEFSLFERLHQPVLLWWGSDPEREFLTRLLREELERALDGLPPVYGEAVVLVDVQGLSYQEVADLLEIPVGTVRSRLARGRSRLQEALWEQGREAGLTRGPGEREPERDESP